MTTTTAAAAPRAPGALARFFAGDVWHSFQRSPVAIVAAVIAALCVFVALFAPWIAPHDPFDLAAVDLSDARLPPLWMEGGYQTTGWQGRWKNNFCIGKRITGAITGILITYWQTTALIVTWTTLNS